MLPPDPRLGYGVRGDYEPLIRRVQAVVDRYAPGWCRIRLHQQPAAVQLPDRRSAGDPVLPRQHGDPGRRPARPDRRARDEDPPLVAYSSRDHGLPVWDGISNPVRHYLVSDYLLDHYHPVAQVEDYVFMARDRGRRRRRRVRHPRRLLFAGVRAIGDTRRTSSTSAPPARASVDAAVRITDLGTSFGVRGWAVDAAAKRRVERVLIVDGHRVIATVPTGVRRDDVAAALESRRVRYSGFESHQRSPVTRRPRARSHLWPHAIRRRRAS